MHVHPHRSGTPANPIVQPQLMITTIPPSQAGISSEYVAGSVYSRQRFEDATERGRDARRGG